jgi:hypothetical protein
LKPANGRNSSSRRFNSIVLNINEEKRGNIEANDNGLLSLYNQVSNKSERVFEVSKHEGIWLKRVLNIERLRVLRNIKWVSIRHK